MKSKHFSKSALKAVNRIGDVICPENGEFPSYSQSGCIEHIDNLLEFAPKNDIKDLNMLLSILSILPGFCTRWLVKKMNNSHAAGNGMNILFRQLDLGLKGIVFGTYYSGKTGENFTGNKPVEVIDFSINRMEL